MAPQKTGRKAKGKAKFPLQSSKLDELVRYLIAKKIIPSQGELSKNFGVDIKTISNWVIGLSPIGIREKKVFAHDFDVPMEWWEQGGIPIADVIGKGHGRDEQPSPLPLASMETEEACLNEIDRMLSEIRRLRQKQPPSSGGSLAVLEK